ncbi:hypothetical protein BV898_16018 [Hypsibius exemplaris]|uniref:Uncharacterized protein n=1 Tax=Hypsibius exemplaris TaxID=2072580 RepID=A0A9X6NDY7_HYPEX|nr:hypothetical protein BV898_16018 [Hypsibius exemplaris]
MTSVGKSWSVGRDHGGCRQVEFNTGTNVMSERWERSAGNSEVCPERDVRRESDICRKGGMVNRFWPPVLKKWTGMPT